MLKIPYFTGDNGSSWEFLHVFGKYPWLTRNVGTHPDLLSGEKAGPAVIPYISMCGIIGAIQKSPVLVITDEGNTGAFSSLPSSVRILEACGLGLDHALLGPILEVVPLQLLAFLVSGALGNDVDQPRNLAKTVTV